MAESPLPAYPKPSRLATLRARFDDPSRLLTTPVAAAGIALAAIVFLSRRLPLPLAVVVTVVVGAVFTAWFYAGLVLTKRTLGTHDLVWVLAAWAAALWWWSVFTEILWSHEIIHFKGHPGAADLGHTTEFYLWNLVDLVPFVDVDHVLRWEQPLDYDPSAIGAFVLMYEVFVVLPVITLIRRVWTQRAGTIKA